MSIQSEITDLKNKRLSQTGATVGSSMQNIENSLQGLLDEKANLVSPTFTGNPTAPTPTVGDNDTSLATTAFVQRELNYTDTTITTATGTEVVNIPTGLPVGHEFTVRKVNATQGTVSINAQGSEKITPALLTTVTLNADGDFWLLEKVSATRWDLVDGCESGSNANGRYYKYANGNAEIQRDTSFLSAPASSSADFILDYPITFLNSSVANIDLKCNNAQTSLDFRVYSSTGVSNCKIRLFNNWTGGADGGYFMIKTNGRWY